MTNKEAMEAAGFTWDPSHNGRERWTHQKLGITALREDWMNDAHWEKRCKEKIAETAVTRLFDDLPLGARFRLPSHPRLLWVKIGTRADLEGAVRWDGLNPKAEESKSARTLGVNLFIFNPAVEVFEPFDELTQIEQRELLKTPGAWEGLADYHYNQSAEAEARDCPKSSKHHEERAKLFMERGAKIRKEWEDG